VIIALCKFFTLACLAGGLPPKSPLDEALAKYASASTLTAELKKSVKLSLLKKETVSEGTISLKKGGYLRLDLEKPQKQILLVTPKDVWSVDYPVEGLDDKIRAAHLKRQRNKKADVFIFSLLGEEKLLRQFERRSQSARNGITTYELFPKSDLEDISKVAVSINKEYEIVEIRWWDALENETAFGMKELKFGTKLPNSTFKFTPPKDAEVTEL
jgi:outer membrane lipoprotein carrier protein